MTDWEERRFECTRWEFEVPTPMPYGATGKDFDVVWSHAARVAKKILGLPEDKPLSEDVLRIKPADEGVIIWFVSEEKVDKQNKRI